jgi:hypothetical protein
VQADALRSGTPVPADVHRASIVRATLRRTGARFQRIVPATIR